MCCCCCSVLVLLLLLLVLLLLVLLLLQGPLLLLLALGVHTVLRLLPSLAPVPEREVHLFKLQLSYD